MGGDVDTTVPVLVGRCGYGLQRCKQVTGPRVYIRGHVTTTRRYPLGPARWLCSSSPDIITPTLMSSIRHADLFAFFSRLLPDEVLLYHSPLPPIRPYDPARTNFHANRVILSLTPTEGVYTALHEEPKRRCVLFLHRPFRLDRRRVPVRGRIVLILANYIELTCIAIWICLVWIARHTSPSLARPIRRAPHHRLQPSFRGRTPHLFLSFRSAMHSGV